MKAELAGHLRGLGHEVLDLGTTSADSVDYPDYGYRMAEAIAPGRAGPGVAPCGSGIRISISVKPPPPTPSTCPSTATGGRGRSPRAGPAGGSRCADPESEFRSR